MPRLLSFTDLDRLRNVFRAYFEALETESEEHDRAEWAAVEHFETLDLGRRLGVDVDEWETLIDAGHYSDNARDD